jgi:hypothetical protein
MNSLGVTNITVSLSSEDRALLKRLIEVLNKARGE